MRVLEEIIVAQKLRNFQHIVEPEDSIPLKMSSVS
jgi:hypothetical protein